MYEAINTAVKSDKYAEISDGLDRPRNTVALVMGRAESLPRIG